MATRPTTPPRPALPATALRAVLHELIDYAGLFPPAGLSMQETVRNYAAYQRRPDAWALARLVVPVARLAEFEAALEELAEVDRLGTRWPITALLGADPAADRAAVLAFNERHVHGGPAVASLEGRAGTPEAVTGLGAAVGSKHELFIELPLDGEPAILVAAVKAAGAKAKIRTGGIRSADFPSPEAVLEFLVHAADFRVPFKATAGLHHPVRRPAPLTYAPGSDRATMFGYLNVVLAATAVWEGQGREAALALLLADDPATLRHDEAGIRWGATVLAGDAITRARREFMVSIGSCSFTEPLNEAVGL